MGILSKKWNFIDGKMSGLRVCPANQINNIDFPRGMRDKVEIRNPVEGTKTPHYTLLKHNLHSRN